jgi:F0F1-type ATP synthase membrane subunit b/b'
MSDALNNLHAAVADMKAETGAIRTALEKRDANIKDQLAKISDLVDQLAAAKSGGGDDADIEAATSDLKDSLQEVHKMVDEPVAPLVDATTLPPAKLPEDGATNPAI